MRREASRSNALIESTDAIAPSPVLDFADTGPERPHYRHAVIPSGVYSADELATAIREDAVVASHYSTVDPSLVRTTVTPAARMAYVSYRIGNRVFWTRKPVRIPAGETLLTDGETEIRARCGNAVSDFAREPVSDVEPMAAELDEPISDDSSLSGERDLVGRAAGTPYVPFLLPAQGAILGNDAPDLPAELHGLGGSCRCCSAFWAGQARRPAMGPRCSTTSNRRLEAMSRTSASTEAAPFLTGSAGEPDGRSDDPNGGSNPGDPGPGPATARSRRPILGHRA